MFTVHVEMPSGALSREHSFPTKDEAQVLFDHMILQMKPWKKFVADVVMLNDRDKEVKREHISNE